MSQRTRKPSDSDASAARRHRALLQVWLSPSFPVGAFAYSHGLERAVEAGWITGRTSLESWLADLVAHGSLPNDLIFIACAWRAVRAGDPGSLRAIAALSCALQPSAERHLEATQQGGSFIHQIDASWPAPSQRVADAFAGEAPTLPVALGFAAGAHDVPLGETLAAYAIAFVSNLTSAAIRLSVVGQTGAQGIIAALMPRLLDAAARAETRSLDDLGSAAWRNDIASMQHETQATRLFRS
jgi:urease accessory protein